MLNTYKKLDSKPVKTPLAAHFKLNNSMCPKTNYEKLDMKNVPYANVVGCLMYVMVLTMPNISHAVSLVSRYMASPGRTLEGSQVDYEILEGDIRLWFSLWQILWNKGRITAVCKCKLCRRFRQKEVLDWLPIYGEWLSNKLESHTLVSGCTLNYRG